MNIESTWYENSPYVYVAGGVVSIANYGSFIAITSGALLLGVALMIIRMRRVYRRNQVLQRERDARALRVATRHNFKNSLPRDDEEL